MRARWIAIVLITVLLELASIALTLALGAKWNLVRGDQIALGQLIVALVLIPLGVVAFWQAREALLQAASRPRLRLAFLGEDGLLHDEYLVHFPASGGMGNRVTLAVENVGDAIAVWWQVTFDLPLKMIRVVRLGNGGMSVTQRQAPLMMDTVGDVERYVAQSAGTVGLFRGPPVQVAVVQLHLAPDFSHRFEPDYSIEYKLVTDRSAEVTGRLRLVMQKG